MSAADTLRQAADLIEQRAGKARPGPWTSDRAILAQHRDVGEGMDRLPDGGFGGFPTSCGTCGTSDEYAVTWPCRTVLLVVSRYRHRPGYRTDEWAVLL